MLGVVADTRLRIAAIDLARLKPGSDAKEAVKKDLETKNVALTPIECPKYSEIQKLINDLTGDAAVEDLARRKNSVDVSVDEYLEKTAVHLNLKLPLEKKDGKDVAARKRAGRPGIASRS